MAQHRSINQKLKRAKSRGAKLATVMEWAQSWQDEQLSLIARLEKALSHDNYDDNCIALGELKAVSIKKFTALPGVLSTLLNQTNAEEKDDEQFNR